MGQAGGLTSTCLYGGSPYPPQEQKLRRGVHIIVGTPGRIQDHIDRGTLKMQKLRCAPATSATRSMYHKAYITFEAYSSPSTAAEM